MNRVGRVMVAAAVAGAFVMTGCSSADSADNASGQVTLRIGHLDSEGSAYELTLQSLDEALQDQTDGRVSIETYPNGQLGGDVQMLEQVQSGNLEGAIANSGPISSMVPSYAALDIPFLFDDLDHARELSDGELGEHLASDAREAGFVSLGLWELGYKTISNNVDAIASPGDAQGVSIRTVENPLTVSTYENLGFSTTPLPYPEVYTAIEQGVVDGSEGPINTLILAGLEEIQPHMTDIEMIYSASGFLLSEEAMESLAEEDQETLLDLAAEHTEIQRGHLSDQLDGFRQTALDAGVEFVDSGELDVEAFRAATETVREQAAQNGYGEVMEIAGHQVD